MFREDQSESRQIPEGPDKSSETVETQQQGFLQRNKVWLNQALSLEGVDQKKRAALKVALSGTYGAVRAMAAGQDVAGALGYIGMYTVLGLAVHKFWENPKIKALVKKIGGKYEFEDEHGHE